MEVSSEVQALRERIAVLERERADARAMLRLMLVAASNTALNLSGGVGVGDQAMERMRTVLQQLWTQPIPRWAYTDTGVTLAEYDAARAREEAGG